MTDLPRVTEVLASVGIIDTSFYDDSGKDRGQAVHLVTHYDDIGDLDEESLDPVLVPYLAGWRKFRAEHECEWRAIETKHVHPAFQYSGIPDREGTVDGRDSILDIKSGAKEWWHRYQLAAYSAFGDNFHLNRIVVRLNARGGYVLDPYGPTTPADLNVFLAALTIHNVKRGKNGNRVG